MNCKDCSLVCAAKAEPQNIAMGKACTALVYRCKKFSPPENPMSWLRGYAEASLDKENNG